MRSCQKNGRRKKDQRWGPNARPAGQIRPAASFYVAPDGLKVLWSPFLKEIGEAFPVLLFWRFQIKRIHVVILETFSFVQYFYTRIIKCKESLWSVSGPLRGRPWCWCGPRWKWGWHPVNDWNLDLNSSYWGGCPILISEMKSHIYLLKSQFFFNRDSNTNSVFPFHVFVFRLDPSRSITYAPYVSFLYFKIGKKYIVINIYGMANISCAYKWMIHLLWVNIHHSCTKLSKCHLYCGDVCVKIICKSGNLNNVLSPADTKVL